MSHHREAEDMSDSKLSGVRVKPLLWNKNDEALVVSRIYRVWKIHNSDKWLVNTNGYTLGGVLDGQYNRMFGSKVEAKVAAQNHYQAAIGEPIKPAQPDPVGYALAIEQAAQVAVNRHSHWHKLGSDCLVDDDVSACADIANAIRALITDRDRDDLAAHVAAEVAKARLRGALTIAETTIADLERSNASYQSALSERGIDGSKGTEE